MIFAVTQKGEPMDLIERQAAIDALDCINGVEEVLRSLPSAQPEIIHCKDCKHFGVDRYKKLTWCSRINYGYGYQADDFCSKAERRTNGVQNE